MARLFNALTFASDLAMVGTIDYQRVLCQSTLFECRQHLSDLMVEMLAESEVRRSGHPDLMLGEWLGHVPICSPSAYWARLVRVRLERRYIHSFVVVIEQRFRCEKGAVGQHKPRHSGKRPTPWLSHSLRSRIFVQPVTRCSSHSLVIGLVGCDPTPCDLHTFSNLTTRRSWDRLEDRRFAVGRSLRKYTAQDHLNVHARVSLLQLDGWCQGETYPDVCLPVPHHSVLESVPLICAVVRAPQHSQRAFGR